MKTRLVTISDVVAGYGSPQIADFSQSVCRLIGTTGVIFQPLVPDRKIVRLDSSLLSLETIHAGVHPHSPHGLTEYLQQCARRVNRIRPDILLICNYNMLDIVDGLAYRPRKIVHLALEDLDSVISGPFGQARLASIRRQSALIDLWLFPEVNRALHDASRLGIKADSLSIFYNVADSKLGKISDSRKINRMVYAGTLDAETSVGRYIFDHELAPFPLDVYGGLQGFPDSISEMKKKVDDLRNLEPKKCHLKWYGQIPASKLRELLPLYSFSLVYWRPVRHGLLNAAPNKFFQAIAAGVPVICAPHPQPKMMVERYGCGVLLDGWEKKHLIAGLEKAQQLMTSEAYGELLANCHRAAAGELSWEVQMNRFAKRFNVKDW